MADNVVEAVLRSKFEDGVSRALDRTSQLVRRTAESMNGALRTSGAVLGGLVGGGVVAGLGFLASGFQAARDKAFEMAGKVVELSSAIVAQTEGMRTLGGLYEFARDKLSGYSVKLAVAVQQSGVFQEAVKRIEDAILQLDPSKDQLNELTLAANRFFITVIENAAKAVRSLDVFVTAFEAAWRTISLVIDAALVGLSAGAFTTSAVLRVLVEALSALPGSAGAAFASLAEELKTAENTFLILARNSAASLGKLFDGVGEGSEKLKALAAELERNAKELRAFEGDVRGLSPALKDTKVDLDAINRSLEQEGRLLRELAGRGANDFTRLLLQYTADVDRINKLEGFSEQRKNQLIVAAREAFHRQIAELNARRLEEENRFNEKLVEDERRMTQEIEQLRERAARSGADFLEQTAKANLAILPAIEAVQLRLTAFQEFLLAFTGAVVDVWANFWSDLVTGQEGAFKKLLAGLLNFIADEIQAHAIRLAKLAFVNFLLGNYGRAAAQAAGAVALGAAAGILRGAASNLADATKDAKGTFQNVAAPTSQGAQRITVGSSGGAQSEGDARARLDRQPPQRVEVVVRAQRGFVVDQVIEDINARGRLVPALARGQA